MEALPEHTIAISGLKDGSHRFSYGLGPDFFQACGREDFLGGRAQVEVDLEKTNHLLVARIHVDGHVDMLCDRCNTPMEQAVTGDQRQIFKLTGEEESDDVELVNLDPDTAEINLTHYIYECISLHLPIRHVHAEGGCDPAVVAVLEKMQVNHEPDPRWAALKDLKQRSA
ncbi:MAG TPA: DUF177 domain-containing protein [Flavobacteriales bacterium]|nr:DUF177 domain-containing protein [Flavobacteriales bacterium]